MVLTVPEAARYLRVSEDVVYRLCASGEIPARRVRYLYATHPRRAQPARRLDRRPRPDHATGAPPGAAGVG